MLNFSPHASRIAAAMLRQGENTQGAVDETVVAIAPAGAEMTENGAAQSSPH